MEISIGNQLLTILNSFFLGLFSCAVYQIFKIIKLPLMQEYSDKFSKKMKDKNFGAVLNPLIKERKHKIIKIVVQSLLDFSYFVLLTPIYAIFFYETSNGVVRWYAFAFSLLGFIVFKISIGKIIERLIEYVGFYLEVSLSFIIYKIKKIIKRIFKRKPKKKMKKEEKKQVLFTYGK